MQQAREIWHHNFNGVDTRGLRKTVLATMFITVSLIYLGQLAKWRILLPVAEVQFASTPLTTLIAASVGAIYLWRMRIPRSIEITLLAIVSAHWLQQMAAPILYAQDMFTGIMWTIAAYVLYTIMLLIAYIASYLLFTAWHTHYRNKLVVAGIIVVLVIASEMMRPQL